MSSTKEPMMIDREQLVTIAFYWGVEGLLLGLYIAEPGDSNWGAVRVVGFLLLAIYETRKAWRSHAKYPVRPEDVAHFTARQAERKRTIGHD